MMSVVKNVLSYLFPIRIKNYHSTINGKLEVNLMDGIKTLDTTKSNYSYGSLQRILYQGLKEIDFNSDINSILVLGLGGGSIIQTIREKFNSNANIDVIEIDQEIIEIAINDFNITRFENLNIVNEDAFSYLEGCTLNYDLIIIDLFIGDQVPPKFYTSEFLNKLTQLLNKNGKLIYNLMHDTIKEESRLFIIKNLKDLGLKITLLENIENTNDLIIGEKRSNL